MSIHVFRTGSSRTFAYSLEVTERNIPPIAEEEWLYERTVGAEQLKVHPEVLQPTQKVIGCLVLERLVPVGLGAWAALSFDARGVEWTCENPVARIVDW